MDIVTNFDEFSMAMAAADMLTEDQFWAENECEFVAEAEFDEVFPDPPPFIASMIFPKEIIAWRR